MQTILAIPWRPYNGEAYSNAPKNETSSFTDRHTNETAIVSTHDDCTDVSKFSSSLSKPTPNITVYSSQKNIAWLRRLQYVLLHHPCSSTGIKTDARGRLLSTKEG